MPYATTPSPTTPSPTTTTHNRRRKTPSSSPESNTPTKDDYHNKKITVNTLDKEKILLSRNSKFLFVLIGALKDMDYIFRKFQSKLKNLQQDFDETSEELHHMIKEKDDPESIETKIKELKVVFGKIDTEILHCIEILDAKYRPWNDKYKKYINLKKQYLPDYIDTSHIHKGGYSHIFKSWHSTQKRMRKTKKSMRKTQNKNPK